MGVAFCGTTREEGLRQKRLDEEFDSLGPLMRELVDRRIVTKLRFF